MRRHLLLLLIGALHFVLVWHGDIISNYALLAGFLLFTARLTARALLTLGVALGAWGQWVWLTSALAAFLRPERPRFAGLPDLSAGHSYAALVAERATEFWPNVIDGNWYNGPWLLCLFFWVPRRSEPGCCCARTSMCCCCAGWLSWAYRWACCWGWRWPI
ncbi:hypothetical protein ACFSC4_14450 [Deinococcus malanensis]|uniref:hypothetical protein n=1 Tax=Deinococcus malanensis TaxID=1706855 RepID=UPI0036370065